jgi:NADPH-dependent glutamate synthase beta subunit-like oxidoreductase
MFAAGDILRGAALIGCYIGSGRDAAERIDA